MMNWKELLEEEMTYRGETLADLISITLTPEELLQEFDDRYCRVRGVPFTAWTEKTVYFPLKSDQTTTFHVKTAARHRQWT